MEVHATELFGACFAAEFRAEMAAKNLGASDLAELLSVSLYTAKRLMSGESSFSVVHMAVGARWLGVTPDELLRRAETRSQQMAREFATAAPA